MWKILDEDKAKELNIHLIKGDVLVIDISKKPAGMYCRDYIKMLVDNKIVKGI